jgi:hypothetical protein
MGGGMGSGEGLSEYLDAATGVAARRVAPSTNPKRLRGAIAAVTVVASAVVASSGAVASEIGMAMVPSSVCSAAHADMQEELARSQRQLRETEAKLQEVERSAAEAPKGQARVLAEREEAWSVKLREAQHEARAVSERHETELDKQAAALRALEQRLAAAEERAAADAATLALSREQAVVEREQREQLEATLRAKSQALEEATNTIAELRHQLAAATETNAELRHQPEEATDTNAELRHQPEEATDTIAELRRQLVAATEAQESALCEVALAREVVEAQAATRIINVTVRLPSGDTLEVRNFRNDTSTKVLHEIIATCSRAKPDAINVVHAGLLLSNGDQKISETSLNRVTQDRQGVHVVAFKKPGAVAAPIPVPAASKRYVTRLEITVQTLGCDDRKVGDIGLDHTTGQFYGRVADVTGIPLDDLRVTHAGVQLPNDNTMIGDTTLRTTQFPTVIAKHVKGQFPYVYAT